MYSILLVGADVEVFLREAQTNNLVTACGKIGGTKDNPRKILGDKFSALQEDNVMLEFNIDPARNADNFRDNINKVLVHIYEELEQQGLKIDVSSSQVFTPEALKHPLALVMGCDPDVSAWSVKPNPIVQPEQLGNLRTSGGHIHITFKVNKENPTMLHKVNLIRMLDLALGVPSVILDPDQDRRRHYGRPGAFRSKGDNHVEYRTMSNFWIKSDELKEWAFNGVSWAFTQLNSRGNAVVEGEWGELFQPDIEKCIKNGDTILANKLIRELQIPMPR